MNFDKLNNWLMLGANLGVLLGIIVVVLELRQTETAMDGEASTMRAQMATDIQIYTLDARIFEIRDKIEAGQELTDEEQARAVMWLTTTLRHFENLHYQYQIGLLGDEIWESNYRGLGDICQNPVFTKIRPNMRGFRESFTALVMEPCK